jgi:hypothetical protein
MQSLHNFRLVIFYGEYPFQCSVATLFAHALMGCAALWGAVAIETRKKS